jgi:hypothetical protein
MVGDQPSHGVGDHHGRARRDQHRRITEKLAFNWVIASYDGHSQPHGFERCEPKSFVQRGLHADDGAGHRVYQIRIIKEAEELQVSVNLQMASLMIEPWA